MNTDTEIQTLLRAWLDPEHMCMTVWESSTTPDRYGNITVTGHCDCGLITSVINDRII